MRNQVNISYQTVIPQLFIVIVGFLILSCSQNKSEQRNTSEKDTFQPPVIISVKNPRVVNLDTCPSPLSITIPARKEDSFILKINNSQTVIHSPEIKPADFSVLM